MTNGFVADLRRRWSEEEKQAIVEESKTSPVSRIAKKHGVAPSLLFRWRKAEGIGVRNRSARPPAEPQFVRVALPRPVAAARPESGSRIEIVVDGLRVIVGSDVDVNALKRVIAALRG